MSEARGRADFGVSQWINSQLEQDLLSKALARPVGPERKIALSTFKPVKEIFTRNDSADALHQGCEVSDWIDTVPAEFDDIISSAPSRVYVR